MLTEDYSCTYKIVATSGAPGFRITSPAAANKILVSWVEYAVDDISAFAVDSTWPALNLVTNSLDCGSNCVQGELPARTKSLNSVA